MKGLSDSVRTLLILIGLAVVELGSGPGLRGASPDVPGAGAPAPVERKVLRVVLWPVFGAAVGNPAASDPGCGQGLRLLELVAQEGKFRIEYVHAASREEALNMIDQGHADLVGGIPKVLFKEETLAAVSREIDDPAVVWGRKESVGKDMRMAYATLLVVRDQIPGDQDAHVRNAMQAALAKEGGNPLGMGISACEQRREGFNCLMAAMKGDVDCALAGYWEGTQRKLLGQHDLEILAFAPWEKKTAWAMSPRNGLRADVERAFSAIPDGVAQFAGRSCAHSALMRGGQEKTPFESHIYKIFLGVLFAAGLLIIVVAVQVRTIRRRKLLESELRVARDEAKNATELKSGFLRVVAHDMKNPLGIIMLQAERLKDEVAMASIPEPLAPVIESIGNASNYMLGLVHNLLSADAIEKGTLELRMEPVAIDEVLKDTCSRFESVARKKSIALDLEILHPGMFVDGNRFALIEVFDNLISNAIKFSRQGTVVKVSLGINYGHVVVSVVDQGLGIPVEMQHRVFERNPRIPVRPTGGERSHGIGLWIVRELIRKMNACICFESEPGKGTRFEVVLPVAASDAVMNDPPPEADEARGGGR